MGIYYNAKAESLVCFSEVKKSCLGSLEYFFKGDLGGKKVEYMLSSRNTLYFKVVCQSFPQLK